jgi:hypothetical protein
MRLRSRRQSLVVWSSSDRYGAPRSTRLGPTRRIRRGVRTGALLVVIGLMRLARTVRIRWRPVLVLTGGVLTVAGGMLSSGVVLVPGLMLLLAAMLVGSDPPTAFVNGAGWTPRSR